MSKWGKCDEQLCRMTHRVTSQRHFHQQESNCESYAWGDALQWSCLLAVREIDPHTSFLHYFLNDFTVEWREEAVRIFLQSLPDLSSAHTHQQLLQAVAWKYLDFWGFMRSRSACQADVQTLMLVVNSVATDYTRPPSQGSLLLSVSVYLWIIHTFISHTALLLYFFVVDAIEIYKKKKKICKQIKSNCLSNKLQQDSTKLSRWSWFQNSISLWVRMGGFALALIYTAKAHLYISGP